MRIAKMRVACGCLLFLMVLRLANTIQRIATTYGSAYTPYAREVHDFVLMFLNPNGERDDGTMSSLMEKMGGRMQGCISQTKCIDSIPSERMFQETVKTCLPAEFDKFKNVGKCLYFELSPMLDYSGIGVVRQTSSGEDIDFLIVYE